MLKTSLKSIVLATSVAVSFGAAAEQDFEKIYVFGDSLSDQGNLNSVTGFFTTFPYFEGSLTNGPVAIDVMADALNYDLSASFHLVGPEQGTNYAVAGAKAFGEEPIDLVNQVNAFFANNGGVADEDNLYVVALGGNDIRFARDAETKREGYLQIFNAVNEIRSQTIRLIEAGAENILFVESGDISVIPESRISETPNAVRKAKVYSALYNYLLKGVQYDLQFKYYGQVEFEYAPLAKITRRILEKADRNGFTNTTEACWYGFQLTFNPECEMGANFNQFIYFDEIHPTAPVHAEIGAQLAKVAKRFDD